MGNKASRTESRRNPGGIDDPGRSTSPGVERQPDPLRRFLVPEGRKRHRLDQRFQAANLQLATLLESYNKLRLFVEQINTNDASTEYQITHSAKDPFCL